MKRACSVCLERTGGDSFLCDACGKIFDRVTGGITQQVRWAAKRARHFEKARPQRQSNALHVPVWVVLMEGHRPYVSTVEHTPGYYQALKAAGHTVVRAEIEIPGYVVDDGKVKSRTVKE